MLILTFSLMMFFLNELLFLGELRSKLENSGKLWREALLIRMLFREKGS